MARVLFFFDYVDPLSWFVESRLSALKDDAPIGTVVERLPFELAPPNEAPVQGNNPAWTARVDQAKSAASGEGLTYDPSGRVPRSRKAMELAFLAAERGAFARVHRMLFEAHLSRGLDIGRVDVLVELAVTAGLDRTETKAVLDVDRHAAAVESWRGKAMRVGVTTTPTILIGEQRFEGLVERSTLETAFRGI